jgi:serine/threonine-protein kinase HipA
MARDKLHVLLGGMAMGILEQDAQGRISFQYSPDWLLQKRPVPLSLSMPVLPTRYTHPKVENWLWGLLPDNEETLRRWAQQFQVSPRNVFSLLAHLGADVAGAIQIVRPEQEAGVLAAGKVKWLDDVELDQRLVALRADAAQARSADDPGRFSLAGVQAKTALLFKNNRWGVPGGSTPTNRIIKLANMAYDGLIENEHFCLRLASALGLDAATTEVMHRAGVTAIVVERYDRVVQGRQMVRLHQEDMCQAMGIHPSSRYQSDGGPGVLEVFEVLRASSDLRYDREAFLRAQIFNFLVGGTDAHAKNFSVLLGEHHGVRLAPLYDIASMLPYESDKKLRLAMKIGRSYEFSNTLPRHWHELGRRLRDVPSPVNILEEYAQRLPDMAAVVARQCRADGLRHSILGRLVDAIGKMCAKTLKQIQLFRKQTD